ncbi:15578_t:CDS:1, partial [Cetraspora pellucida]
VGLNVVYLGVPLIFGASINEVLIAAGFSAFIACYFKKLTWVEFLNQSSIDAFLSLTLVFGSNTASYTIKKILERCDKLANFLKISKPALVTYLISGSAIIFNNIFIEEESYTETLKELFTVFFFGTMLSFGLLYGTEKTYNR